MASLVSDSFTDTNNTELSLHLPETGGLWIKHPLLTTYAAKISGNAATFSSAGEALYYSNTPIGSPDYSVQGVNGVQPNYRTCVCGRVRLDALTYYQFYWRTTGAWNLSRMVAGVETTLLGATWTAAFVAGDVAKLEMIGTTINGYVNGTLRCTATDANIAATGYAGLRLWGAAGTLDNFLVDGMPAGAPAINGGDDSSVALGRTLIQGGW